MLKTLRRQFGRLRDLAVAMRPERLYESGHITMQDLLMLKEGDPHDRLRILSDRMGVENVIAAFPMPLGVAEHFTVNGRDIPAVPMVTEERTVVAAASKAAKLCGPDGFVVETGPAVARAQVLLRVPNAKAYVESLPTSDMAGEAFLEIRNAIETEGMPFRRHDGGEIVAVDRTFLKGDGHDFDHVRLTVSVTTGEAMGARGVTAYAKALGEHLARTHDWKPVSWICLNDNPARKVMATAIWPHSDRLDAETCFRVTENAHWAAMDPERAVTHNKGIMNAVCAIAVATSQDTRAIEAGFWADAYRSGRCKPLGTFHDLEHGIFGRLEMQLTVGTVGGATSHPFAQFSRRLMGAETSADLMAVMGAVGLAQNFAALAWALDT